MGMANLTIQSHWDLWNKCEMMKVRKGGSVGKEWEVIQLLYVIMLSMVPPS